MQDPKRLRESWRLSTRSWLFFLKIPEIVRFVKKNSQDLVDNLQDSLNLFGSWTIFFINF
jgi:hypothetical protein